MKRWEIPLIPILALAMLVIPLRVRELYPFSLPSMFSIGPRQLAVYTVSDGEGRSIEPEQVSLHVPTWHDPPVRTLGRNGYGRRRAASVYRIGEVASPEVIEKAVRDAWKDNPSLAEVIVVRQEVYGRGPDGKVACLEEHRWRWSRSDDPVPIFLER